MVMTPDLLSTFFALNGPFEGRTFFV